MSKVIFISSFILLILLLNKSSADIFMCTDSNGKTFYLDSPCPSSAKSTALVSETSQSKKYSLENPHPDSGKAFEISENIVKECYLSYQKMSLDPNKSEILGYRAMISKDGSHVLTVDAVFRNKFGGPERLSCYCKLTENLELDAESLKKSTFDYYLKARGEERLRQHILSEEIKKGRKK